MDLASQFSVCLGPILRGANCECIVFRAVCYAVVYCKKDELGGCYAKSISFIIFYGGAAMGDPALRNVSTRRLRAFNMAGLNMETE